MTKVSDNIEENFETYPCDICGAEPDQEHACSCGTELTEEECKEWGGLCNVCAWGIKH